MEGLVVLKGKYSPCTSLCDAKTPPNSSYTWRSILSAREIIKEGSTWVIGNGQNVRFWKEAWLPTLPGGRLLSPPPSSESGRSYVSEWRTDDGQAWDVQAMYEHLTTTEIDAPLQVRCAESD